MPNDKAPGFINVDLTVYGKQDLSLLADALSPRVTVLFVGKVGTKYMATFEVESSARQRCSPEARIWSFIRILKTLKPNVRTLWKRAASRTFDIGVESGIQNAYETRLSSRVVETKPAHGPMRVYEASLSPRLLAAIAELGANVDLTVYPAMLLRQPGRTTASSRRHELR